MFRSRLCHVVIDCNDLDAGSDFWAAALGAKPEPVDPGSTHVYRRLKLPDSNLRILLQLVPEEKQTKTRIHLDIESDDVELECRRLEALGATRSVQRRDRGYLFWVMLDPFANEFCVLEPEFPDILRAEGNSWPA